MEADTNKSNQAKKQTKICHFNRCLPYAYGAGLAWTTGLFLSYLDEVERLEENESFKLFRQSLKDSERLQILSLTTAAYDGPPHDFLNGPSAKDPTVKDNFGVGAMNVAGETANAAALRYSWSKLSKTSFITGCRKRLGNNHFVNSLPESPEPVKRICKDIGYVAYLFTIRMFWHLEKAAIKKLLNDKFKQS